MSLDHTDYHLRTVEAAQARATPRVESHAPVHYARGWLKGGIDFTGCDLRLAGELVAGRLGGADETTCPCCLAWLAKRGGKS